MSTDLPQSLQLLLRREMDASGTGQGWGLKTAECWLGLQALETAFLKTRQIPKPACGEPTRVGLHQVETARAGSGRITRGHLSAWALAIPE